MINLKEKDYYLERSRNYFLNKYNCCQTIVLTFNELYSEVNEDSLIKLASPLGGGISRKRDICGALLGIEIALGLIVGPLSFENEEDKNNIYLKGQTIFDRFKEINGYTDCGDLLKNAKLEIDDNYKSSKRNSKYYKERPCLKIIDNAVEIFYELLSSL